MWNKTELEFWIKAYEFVLTAFITFSNSNISVTPAETPIEIWKPEYDAEDFTEDMILADMGDSGMLDQFEGWFTEFYGPSGLVGGNGAQDMPSSDNIDMPPISDNLDMPMNHDLDDIIAWISKQVDKEVQEQCTYCKE